MSPLKQDFRNFLYVIWKHLGLPPPTPVQYDIAHYLQHGPERRIVEAFRGAGKSWVTSAYCLWRLDRDPDYKILVVSASKGRSDDFTAFTKRLINEVPFLNYLKAREGQRDSMIAFDVGPASPAHAPSVKSVGIFGQLTGSRANEIIADDIEVPNNSATQGMREKLLKAALEFEAIILPGGKITYLGTPQSEESIYNELRNRGYSARIWPVKYPSIDKVDNYGGDLAPMILEKVQEDPSVVGKSTEPDRFSELDLAAREASFGRSGFNLQFMLDTTLSDAERYPLKLSDLIILPLDSEKGPISLAWANHPNLVIEDLPNVGFTGDRFHRPLRIDDEWIPYEGSVMVIDPAGRGQDETSYAVVKQLHGYLFVTALGGLKGGYDDATMTALSKIARDQKVNVVIIEANFGDGMFTRLLQPIISKYHQCALEEVRNHTQKERRIIDTLEPVMNRHRLVIDYDAVQRDIRENQDTPAYSLFYQMTRITPERGALKHDDRLDALAMGVAYWVESMSRDEERAYQEHQQTKLDDELRVFMEHAIGYRAANSGDVRIDFLK